MSNEDSSLHFGSLFNLLRQVTTISRDAAREVETYYLAKIREENEKELLYQLPSVGLEGENIACVVPVTVMFVDLRNFTAMVEEYPPNQVVRQLNEYFSSMTRIIVEHGGILDKYMGDEIMAYFECQSPLEYPKAANNAVCAAIKMIQVLERLNATWQQRGWSPLKSGIGINSGPVLKGNIGSMVKMETTIIGDTVNVASRLQQMNKEYDARLLISASTYNLIQGEFPVRSLGELAIRGKRKLVGVYELDLQAITAYEKQYLSQDQGYPSSG